MADGIEFSKIDVSGRSYLSAYIVSVNGKTIGVVWSQKGFSYRGTQGWNRGIRCRDFHPTEWTYGKQLGDYISNRRKFDKRRQAVEALIKYTQEPTHD